MTLQEILDAIAALDAEIIALVEADPNDPLIPVKQVELAALIAQRDAEEDRLLKKDLTSRAAALGIDLYPIGVETGESRLIKTNMPKLLIKIIDDRNVADMEKLEAAKVIVDQRNADAEADRLAKLQAYEDAKVVIAGIDVVNLNTGQSLQALKDVVTMLQSLIAKE